MSPATKAEAVRQLDTYTVKVGYPDTPRGYTGVVIRNHDLVGDMRRPGRLGLLHRPSERAACAIGRPPRTPASSRRAPSGSGPNTPPSSPLPGVQVDGALTMGENIADLDGLTVALDAYHASLHGRPAPMIDGLTGDQRVFLGWAQAWRGKVRDDALRRQVVSEPHSPRQYRVNGVVRNVDAWYPAFGAKPGEQLYTAPADRVRIW